MNESGPKAYQGPCFPAPFIVQYWKILCKICQKKLQFRDALDAQITFDHYWKCSCWKCTPALFPHS